MDEIQSQRDTVVEAVKSQMSDIVDAISPLYADDYVTVSIGTDTGSWTLKLDSSDINYLRYESQDGQETYVVSGRGDPASPGPLVEAMNEYPEMIESLKEIYTDYADDLSDVQASLEDIDTDAIANAGSAAAEARDETHAQLRQAAEAVADEIRKLNSNDYGSFKAEVDGDTWELKYNDSGGVDYLRIGGRGGTYLISSKYPPEPRVLSKYGPMFETFSDKALNWIENQGSDTDLGVSITDGE